MEKKNINFRYVAGACFGIEALYIIINNIVAGYTLFGPWTLVLIVGYVLIAVSMFASVDILASVGGGFLAVNAINSLIEIISFISDWHWDTFWYILSNEPLMVISEFIWPVVCILFAVIGLNRKHAKTISIVAAALIVVRFIIVALAYKIYLGSFPHLNLVNLLDIIFIAGTIMIGLVLNVDDVKSSSSKNASSNSINLMTPAENHIDRLTKLKGLLDNGVISQEEFDAKKKQILGQ